MNINEWGAIWKANTLPFIYHLADCGYYSLDPRDVKLHWRTFDDHEDRRDLTLAASFYGSFRDEYKHLLDLNERGAGIFVTVNETDGITAKAEGITNIRAYWADSEEELDTTKLDLPPSMVIRSKRGPHLYWLSAWDLDCKADGKEQCSRVVRNIAAMLGTDPKVKDCTRVMRVPGFYHQKDPANPFMVTLEEVKEFRYAYLDMLAQFHDPPEEAPRRPLPLPRIVPGNPKDVVGRAQRYVAAIEGVCKGERDHMLFQISCRLMRGFALTEAQALPILEDYCSRCMPPEDPRVCPEKLRNALLYGDEEPGGKL